MQAKTEFSKAPYYEIAAKTLLMQFGADTMTVVDRAIEALEENGQDFALDVWRELRLILERTPVAHAPVTIQ